MITAFSSVLPRRFGGSQTRGFADPGQACDMRALGNAASTHVLSGTADPLFRAFQEIHLNAGVPANDFPGNHDRLG